MPRPLKRQLQALDAAIIAATTAGLPYAEDLRSLRVRLVGEPDATTPRGPSPSAVERVLNEQSNGKVATAPAGMASGWWAAQALRIRRLGVTLEDAHAVGRWLAVQDWFRGPTTLETVLRKWNEWRIRALATNTPQPRRPAALEDPS